MFHCETCNISISVNDKKNHLNGSKHKYKIRKKKGKIESEEPKIKCDICHSGFTNEEFYKKHMGTKTHKRNLRKENRWKALKNVPLAEQSTILDDAMKHGETFSKPVGRRMAIPNKTPCLENVQELNDYKGVKDKYRLRNVKNYEAHFTSYLHSVVAYWAIAFIADPTVVDFKLSVNDRAWGRFGDVVVEVTSASPQARLRTVVYAVHLKGISDNVKSIEDFGKSKFSLEKSVCEVVCNKPPKSDSEVKYIIYTTASLSQKFQPKIRIETGRFHEGGDKCDVNLMVVALGGRKNDLINTSEDKGNIYLFQCLDKGRVLPNIYFYVNQKRMKRLGGAIDSILSSLLDDTPTDLHKDFIKYVQYWSDGLLGGTYKLNKEDLLVKIGDLLLKKFRVNPSIVASVDFKENFGVWNQGVNSVDVTVLRHQPNIVHRVCKPINLLIRKYFDMDITTKTIKINQDSLGSIKNKALKMYLCEETLGSRPNTVPLDVVYNVFWKAGLAPTMLEAEEPSEQEFIVKIISLLKFLGLTRRYFFKTANNNVKDYLKASTTLTYFQSVDDLTHYLPPALFDQVKIPVSNTYSLSLGTIQTYDKFFLKSVTANEFFDMSLGKFSFKLNMENNTHKKTDTKLVLSDRLIKTLREEMENTEREYVLVDKKVETECLRALDPNLF